MSAISKKTSKLALNPIIGIVVWSILYMIFMPFGTFDYTKYEFYRCILQAVLMELGFMWWLKQSQKATQVK